MVDKSRSRKEGGAGIGMALCQKIITLHQGELKIDSKLGEGTVMRLYFPGEIHAVKNKGRENYPGHQLGVSIQIQLEFGIHKPACSKKYDKRQNVIP